MEVFYGVTMMFGVSKNERKPHRKSPLTSSDENNFFFSFKSSFPLRYDYTFSFSNRLLFNLSYVRLPISPLMVHFFLFFQTTIFLFNSIPLTHAPSSFSGEFLFSFFLSFSNHQPTVPIFFSKMVLSFPMHASFLSHMEHVESHAKQIIKIIKEK